MHEPRRPAEGLFALERQTRMARLVEEHRRIRVAELSARFRVSAVGIRTDLLAHEDGGANP